MDPVNGLGAPSVMPPFTLGLGTPMTTNAYGNAIPSLGAFALATTTGMGQTNPASLRGFSNVLLVSNLNEEVSAHPHLLHLYSLATITLLYNLIYDGFVYAKHSALRNAILPPSPINNQNILILPQNTYCMFS